MFAVVTNAIGFGEFFGAGQLSFGDERAAFPRGLGRDFGAAGIFVVMLLAVGIESLGPIGVVGDDDLIGALVDVQELGILRQAIPLLAADAAIARGSPVAARAAPSPATRPAASATEIGRASCRERVCLVV